MEMLGKKIRRGVRNHLELVVASLYTRTRVSVPVIVHKAKKEGPTLLIISGIHGDEINGIEINRRILHTRSLIPKTGAVIHIPVANVMAFINVERGFADGRDLNRCFPGSRTGSLASQLGYMISEQVVPFADAVVDLHTGAADRSNAPQIRFDGTVERSEEIARSFNAPFTFLQPKPPRGSLRRVLGKRGIPNVIFEAGKSKELDQASIEAGVRGVRNVAYDLGIIDDDDQKKRFKTVDIGKSTWLRAGSSGMFEAGVERGAFVQKGDVLGYVNGPFAQYHKRIKARGDGYVICVNESPVVHKGDAIFRIGLPAETNA